MSEPTQNTPEQIQGVSNRPTDWSRPMSFAQFDPAFGTLQSFAVGLTADLAGSVSVESLEAAPATVSAALSSSVGVRSPTGAPLAAITAVGVGSTPLAAFDGGWDYAGASGATLALAGSASTGAAFQQGGGQELGAFVGSGSVVLGLSDVTRLSVSGPANLQLAAHTAGGAVVSLQYGYQPASGGSVSGASAGSVITLLEGSSPTLLPLDAVTTPQQIFTVADATTGWSSAIPVARFDPAIGTLLMVNLTLSGNIRGAVDVQNENSAASSVSTTQTAFISLGTFLSVSPTVNDSLALAAGAERLDQGLTGSAGDDAHRSSAADLAGFTGSGTLSMPISAVGTSTLDGPGNLQARLLAQAGATVTVSYTYLKTTLPAAVTWTAADGDWENAANWSAAPGADTDVALRSRAIQGSPYTIRLDQQETVRSLVIDAPEATLVLAADLTVTGDIVLYAGKIVFEGGKLQSSRFIQNGGLIAGTSIDISASDQLALNAGSIVGDTVTLSSAIGGIASVNMIQAGVLQGAIGGVPTVTVNATGPLGTAVLAGAGITTAHAPVLAPVSGAGPILAGQAFHLGATDSVVSLTDPADTVFGGAGTATVNASAGSGLVLAGAGDVLLHAIAGTVTLQGGTGAATVIGGGGTPVVIGNAAPLLFGGGSQAATVGGSSGTATIFGGNGGGAFWGGSGDLLFVGGAGASTVVGGSGASTLFGGANGDAVWGGSGDMLFVGGSGASTVVGGSGSSTLFGGSSGRDVLVAGSGPSTVVGSDGSVLFGTGSAVLAAGGGSETLVGSTDGGDNTMFAGTGNNIMFGGTGNDVLVAATGNATVVGGQGHELLVFNSGAAGGSIVVWQFSQGQDHVGLFGYGARAAQDALRSAVTSGEATTITLADNTRVTFGGLTELGMADFIVG